EEKINYLRIATGVCGYGFKNEQLDLIVSLYELVLEKKGETDITSICKVEEAVKKTADIKNKQELLDKVGDNVK
nr:hypothetical protein [Bacteroidota bacterium]